MVWGGEEVNAVCSQLYNVQRRGYGGTCLLSSGPALVGSPIKRLLVPFRQDEKERPPRPERGNMKKAILLDMRLKV